MGALPKRKISQARRGNRRSHDALQKINLVSCPNCHKLHLPHHVCPHCGHYKGVEVVEIGPAKKGE